MYLPSHLLIKAPLFTIWKEIVPLEVEFVIETENINPKTLMEYSVVIVPKFHHQS